MLFAMPYALTSSAPLRWNLRLWPHNALGARGFAVVIAFSAGVLALPMLAVLGRAVLWGLLPFAALVVWGLWLALRRNWRDRAIVEEMHLSRDEVHLRRIGPRGGVQEWHAHPQWIALHLAASGGPVEHYLTLTGGTREVEIGAFLTPEERIALYDDLARILLRLREPG
jgi:uncharacterized membrane protein